jgi:hypothetical protein
MRKLALLAALVAAIAPSSASAVAPFHDSFSVHVVDVDTTTCDFPVTREFDFTNRINDQVSQDGMPKQLLLHQSTVGTISANANTLRFSIRETIMVDFENGIPVSAKHVGNLDFIGGAGKPLFHRSGQATFQVVFDPISGFFVDGPLTARHGLRDDFDPVAFCEALV